MTPEPDPRTPLPVYADRELFYGRFRAFVPRWLFDATGNRDGHDRGDEDKER